MMEKCSGVVTEPQRSFAASSCQEALPSDLSMPHASLPSAPGRAKPFADLFDHFLKAPVKVFFTILTGWRGTTQARGIPCLQSLLTALLCPDAVCSPNLEPLGERRTASLGPQSVFSACRQATPSHSWCESDLPSAKEPVLTV